MSLTQVDFKLEIPALLRHLTATAVVIVDHQGIIKDANQGFLFLSGKMALPETEWNGRELFIQPGFSELVSILPEQPGIPVYQGLLNIGDLRETCRTIVGSVFHNEDKLLIIGEHDISDIEKLNATVLELNNELSQIQRDLVRVNRELQRKESEITQLMLTDPMTNIANRRHFHQRAEEDIARSQRYDESFCLAMGDIDLFKSVNDTYGHDVGDIVIKRFAHTIRDALRKTDFVARIGGEEFVILLNHTSIEEGILVIERIRALFMEIEYDVIDRDITASFGISLLSDSDNLETLMKRADEGLYLAKNNGRNQVFSK